MAAFREAGAFEADESGDKDKMAMFADALPKQQRMLMQSGLLILPVLPPENTARLLRPGRAKLAQLLRIRHGARLENMLLAATAENEGLGAAFHIPVGDEKAGKIKEIVRRSRGLRVHLPAHDRLSC